MNDNQLSAVSFANIFLHFSLSVLSSNSVMHHPVVNIDSDQYTFLDFIYLFLERRGRREKERKRNMDVWLYLTCPLLGTWPATQPSGPRWESNWWPFGSQASTQSTEPHHPGHDQYPFISSYKTSFLNFFYRSGLLTMNFQGVFLIWERLYFSFTLKYN